MTSTIKIQDAVEVREGVTIYRNGRFRMIHLDSPSQWCATLFAWDRPSTARRTLSKVYDGSSYVDCVIEIGTNGQVRIQDLFGSVISGAKYGFLVDRTVCYYV